MVKPLSPERSKQAIFQYTQYEVLPEAGITPEDLLSPEYWVHESRIYKRFDRIVAHPDDDKWYAEYLVLESGIGYVKMKLLLQIDLDVAGDPLPSESPVEVQFKGSHRKHIVVRKSDNFVLKEGISLKSDAEAYAKDYATRIAA